MHALVVALFLILRFFGKCIRLQPFQKLHVHAQSPEGILGRVDMQVHKTRDDQAVPVVMDRIAAHLKRKGLVHSFNTSVFTDQISVLADLEFGRIFTVYNISF